MYPKPNEWIMHMTNLDIAHYDPVVCYDDYGIVGASKCYWLMKLYGVKDVLVLNGGFK